MILDCTCPHIFGLCASLFKVNIAWVLVHQRVHMRINGLMRIDKCISDTDCVHPVHTEGHLVLIDLKVNEWFNRLIFLVENSHIFHFCFRYWLSITMW